MKFEATKLRDVYIVGFQWMEDARGGFARTWCRDEFERQGLDPELSQCSVSMNTRAGTLRGMHYQDDPHPEAKLVICARGRIFDVAVDLRPDSDTRFEWVGVELRADWMRALYIPPGCAHGFLTLEDDSIVLYHISESYRPELSRGVRWDDPVLGIQWPSVARMIISDRDRGFPLLPAAAC
jgi:dTDP-4-dehydrorhamnose 3,5-epimerase